MSAYYLIKQQGLRTCRIESTQRSSKKLPGVIQITVSCVFPLTAPTLGLQSLIPPDPMTRLHLKRASPDQEFPNLCGNFTWMARVLTPAMYQRQFHRCTNSGVIFDDIIRPGLEAPGDDVTHSRQSRITRYASTFDFKNKKLCLHEDLELPALNRIIFQPVRLGQANQHPQRKKKWSYGRGSPVEGSLCFKEQYMLTGFLSLQAVQPIGPLLRLWDVLPAMPSPTPCSATSSTESLKPTTDAWFLATPPKVTSTART